MPLVREIVIVVTICDSKTNGHAVKNCKQTSSINVINNFWMGWEQRRLKRITSSNSKV